MRVSLFLMLVISAAAFTAPAARFNNNNRLVTVRSAVEEAAPEKAPAVAEKVAEEPEIPTNLPSDAGMDYVPLATMLATGQYEEADQFTRDALIELAGSKKAGRSFVYFTEVKRIPSKDLATIERLWNKFSKGKFGYSVQKVCHLLLLSIRLHRSQVVAPRRMFVHTYAYHFLFSPFSHMVSLFNYFIRFNTESPNLTLKSFAARLVGTLKMEMSNARRGGSVLRNLPTTSRRRQRDTCR
jgi:hypothetical protein